MKSISSLLSFIFAGILILALLFITIGAAKFLIPFWTALPWFVVIMVLLQIDSAWIDRHFDGERWV